MLFTMPCRSGSMFQSTAEDSVSESQPASMSWRGKKTWTLEKAGIPVSWEENASVCSGWAWRSGPEPHGFQTQGQPALLSVMMLSLKEPFYLKLQKLLKQYGRREKDSQPPLPTSSIPIYRCEQLGPLSRYQTAQGWTTELQ